ADLSRAKQNFERADRLSKEGLLAKETFDRAKADYEISAATLNASKAHLSQAEAQLAQVLNQRDTTMVRTRTTRAQVTSAKDRLSKATIQSTLDGIITYLPVNEGEIAIVGVQNQPGTVLMTIADMSFITDVVMVDETDFVIDKCGRESNIIFE